MLYYIQLLKMVMIFFISSNQLFISMNRKLNYIKINKTITNITHYININLFYT